MTEFPLYQCIDKEGEWIAALERPSEKFTMACYRNMLRIRSFDRKAVMLQRQGRLGTYAMFEGQEAAQVGSALALEDTDWLFPTYRDHGAMLTFGADMVRTFLYWNGRLEGCVPPEGKHIFPAAVPIATQLPHAAGVAMSLKRKKSKQAVIAYFGDGATSEGDFHEGLNFASVFQVPAVFFCQNNQFAISVPIEKQMNSETIAQKSVAYGIPGVRVDGNDVFAVHHAVREALTRARAGDGPTLIEAVTWRFGAHTTADDPTRYRDQEKSEFYRKNNDPLARLERYMRKCGILTDEKKTEIEKASATEINEAVAAMEAYPAANVNDLFDHVFATPVWPITEQKEKYMAELKGVSR
ncbi:pyruvate dehydrogenase (acetyl-transferring) E1 component subunit alpha [Shouchella lonarensis]|uniref:Pyruvate dehydrogenase E1 component subunit alpha n=1 Tax=Shouchella lonarensis TaxID=1464122 RepID=A0A1G6H9A9_9BACI|nr:pyruvate dehydrogenase (acetyl-transferring) E1 component subunit alpha [Shouchella lonarensis]SDB90842.1 pyruvate dehydrogenase E1 component alpha subunit [Shouchella lonarensis]